MKRVKIIVSNKSELNNALYFLKNDRKHGGQQNPYVEGNSIIITPDQENLLRECGVLFTVVDRSTK